MSTPTYQKLIELIPDLPKHLRDGTEHGKSKSEGYMDLCFDYLTEESDGEHIISLAHYFESNGDLVPDPDMEIRVNPEMQTAQALTFQNQFLYQDVRDNDNPRLQQDLNDFLDQWLANALAQGHRIDLAAPNREHDATESQSTREDLDEIVRKGKSTPGKNMER